MAEAGITIWNAFKEVELDAYIEPWGEYFGIACGSKMRLVWSKETADLVDVRWWQTLQGGNAVSVFVPTDVPVHVFIDDVDVTPEILK